MANRSAPLPNRLREHRLRANISQKRLAELAGYEQGQVSKWESGARGISLATAARLAAVLGCHAEELLEVTVPAVA